MIIRIFILCIVVISSELYSGLNVNRDSSYSLTILSETASDITMRIKINHYNLDMVKLNNEVSYKVVLKGATSILKPGFPNIPRIVRGIAVPENAVVKLEVTLLGYDDVNISVAPCPENRKRNSTSPPKYVFSDIYGKDCFYPGSSCSLSESYMIRDQKGVNLFITPFQYNPAQKILRIYKEMVVKVSFVNSHAAYKTTMVNHKSKVFEQVCKHSFLNYKPDVVLAKTMNIYEREGMLVIAPSVFMQVAQSFVNHKTQNGFDVELVNLTTIGSTHEQIKSYIDSYYATHENLTYVVLVGDYEQIPCPVEWNPYPLPPYTPVGWYPQDPKYSLISGSDNYPDIIVGRLSGETELQIQRIISKTIYYEQNLSGGAWTRTALSIAGSDDGGGTEEDWEHLRDIDDTYLSNYFYTINEGFQGSRGGADDPGDPTSGWVSARIMDGVSLLNYTGHGTYTLWDLDGLNNPVYTNSNIVALSNNYKLPFVFSVACDVGGFLGRTCFAEQFLRKWNESESAPTGVIGFYGSSDALDWDPPKEAQIEFNSMLISGESISYGALCFNASIRMLQAFPNDQENFYMWHYFGDPSVLSIMTHGDCPENNLVQIDVSSGSHTFTANNSLIANNTISGTASVFMGANQSISLSPGFWVQNGATLEVNNVGCVVLGKKHEYCPDSVNTGQGISLEESIIMYPVSPNPFNPSAVIKFNIKKDSKPSNARLDIFSLSGQLIRTYSIQLKNTGTHTIVWDAKNMANMEVSAGVYLARLYFGEKILTTKLTYVR